MPQQAERDPALILCVARIEGRKNQLNLIRALANTAYQLVIIGKVATNQQSYFKQCMRSGAPNISFIPFMNQDDLLSYYRRAKIHVLASWFETTGLSSLEAAAMGCNIVVSRKGDTEEYFRDQAFYCDPESPQSILEAVELAAGQPASEALAKMVRAEYNWEIAATKTLAAYQEVLAAK